MGTEREGERQRESLHVFMDKPDRIHVRLMNCLCIDYFCFQLCFYVTNLAI